MSHKQRIALLLSVAFLSPLATFAMDNTRLSTQNENLKAKVENKLLKANDNQAIDVKCVQAAISTRETALLSAFDSFSVSTKSALTARKDGLLNAWAKTDSKERRQARKDVSESYRSAMKKTHEALKSSKKTIWSSFNTEVKKCAGVNGYSEVEDRQYPTSL